MGQPYVGEIRLFAGNFNPNGWMFCDGTPLPISENDVLFQLIGTTYGGDGQTTFNLPDLRGRLPMHKGSNGMNINPYNPGDMGGVESVTLTTQQIPVHNHGFLASTDSGAVGSPNGNVLATEVSVPLYKTGLVPTTPMSTQMVQASGGNQPHENMQPYLCLNYIISLFGIYPSPT